MLAKGVDMNAKRLTRTCLRIVTLLCVGSLACKPVDEIFEGPRADALSGVGCLLTSNISGLQSSGQIFWPSGNPTVDGFHQQEGLLLVNTFGVAPSGAYFDDSGAPNAYATPQAYAPNGPSGTVVYGISLMQQQLQTDPSGASVVAILAHEFGHVAQFTFGGIQGPGKAPELHADYLAGWYLAHRGTMSATNLSSTLQVFYAIGDYQFNNPGHHGTPDERLSAAMAGFNAYVSGTRDFGVAYNQGLGYVLWR